jgi:hypothetical protein
VIRRALSLLAMAGIYVVIQRALGNAAHPGKAVTPEARGPGGANAAPSGYAPSTCTTVRVCSLAHATLGENWFPQL